MNKILAILGQLRIALYKRNDYPSVYLFAVTGNRM